MWEQMAVPKKIAALVCGYCLLATRVEELLSKERLGYFLRGPARPRQNPGGFLQLSLSKILGTARCDFHLNIARLGFPMNASDYSP